MTVHDPKMKTKLMNEAPERPVTLETDEARQGDSRLSTTTILVASLLLAAFVWIGAEIYGSLVQDENFATDASVPETSMPLTANDPATMPTDAPANQAERTEEVLDALPAGAPATARPITSSPALEN